MEDKRSRIIETAIELAEQGGFEAVRLRDVARRSEVALGTLYKRFRSKEDILVAALEMEAAKLERRLALRPPRGDSTGERLTDFFDAATRALLRRPNLARAVLRALTSGDRQLARSVMGFHQRMTVMIVGAMRGPAAPLVDGHGAPSEHMVAFVLQQTWFAALVGWMAGMADKGMVIDQVRLALDLLLRGLEAPAGATRSPPAALAGERSAR